MTQDLIEMQNGLCYLEFCRQVGVNRILFRRLIQRHPDLNDLLQAGPKEIAEIIIGPPDKIRRIYTFFNNKRLQEHFAQKAKSAVEQGIRAVFYTDPRYPGRLKEISGCPALLFYRGQDIASIFAKEYFVTLVGTRTPTPYGKMVSRKIVADLAASSVVIISGMARGIDAEVHRTALQEGATTIAVIGCGPDLVYPPEHADLMEEIARSGLVISELPPGVPPRRQHFPARNRILSGLADAVVVIEASVDSGTMITAGFAGEQGRDVFAVPGSILSPLSQGCNKLIQDGAEVLTCAEDILWRLPKGALQTRIEQDVRTAVNRSETEDLLTRVINALAGHDMSMADLAVHVNLSLSDMAGILTGMEMNGLVVCSRGRYSLTESSLCCNNS